MWEGDVGGNPTMGQTFSRDLPDPGIEPESPTLQADSLLSEPPEKLTACIRKFLFLIVNIFET